MEIKVKFNKLELKYITILISQAKRDDLKDKDPTTILVELMTLLESRRIYISMFGPEFQEEKQMLPELIKAIKLLST